MMLTQILDPDPSDAAVVGQVLGARGDVNYDEYGSVALTAGQTEVEVAFLYEKETADYRFEYLYVEDSNSVPEDIRAVVNTKTTLGFLVQLSGAPDTGLSILRWHVMSPDPLHVTQPPTSQPHYVLGSVPGSGLGTVSNVSVVTANGFSGSVATPSTTPAITLSLLSTITEGPGLAGNVYNLSASRVLALGTPSSLSISSANAVSGTTHTHAIASSSDPGPSASLLSTDSAGQIALVGLLAHSSTFELVNSATTVNFAGAATTVNIGATTGTLNLNSGVVSFTGTLLTPALAYNTDIGQLTKKFRSLYVSELWVETLVAQDTLATIGGRVLIGRTTSLIADVSPAGTTIDVKHNSLVSGDRVYLESVSKIEFMAVTSSPTTITGGYRYSVTRNLDGTGANQWYTGDAVFDTGVTGTGWIDLYSVNSMRGSSETGPTIAGNVRNSSTYNDWSTRWAVGNLKGLYGFGSETYGAGFGRYATASETWITIDTSLGYRLGNNTAIRFTLSPTGTLMLGSDISAPATTSIVIPSTSITYNGGGLAAGDMLLGDNTSGVANFRFNRLNNRFEWRSGNTVKGYIDQNAVFNMNSGALVLGASTGLTFDQVLGGGSGGLIVFRDSSVGDTSQSGHKLGSDIWETYSQSGLAAANTTGYADNSVKSADNSGNASVMTLRAMGSAAASHANKSALLIYGLAGGSLTDTLFQGVMVNGYGWPSHMLEVYGTGYFTGTLTFLVGGAIKTAEVGAADSGGAGYRMLRVLN